MKNELEELLSQKSFKDINDQLNCFKNAIKRYPYIAFFGAGGAGIADVKNFFDLFPDVIADKTIFFVDNDSEKWNSEILKNIKCISIDTLKHHSDETLIFISTDRYRMEIYQQLKQEGFNNIILFLPTHLITNYRYFTKKINEWKSYVKKVFSILADEESRRVFVLLMKKYVQTDFSSTNFNDVFNEKMYFPDDIIKISNKEVFLDIGSFDGDSIQLFLNEADSKFAEIHGFEMEFDNYTILKNNIDKLDSTLKNKIYLYNIGLWNEKKEMFYSGSGAGAELGTCGKKAIVDTLDAVFINKEVTFIKMDIEGAEIKALEGAERIIKRYKPKLAISIYHNPTDFWEIPLYIKKIVPEYKLYIRHHSLREIDTVCYAVI